MLAPLLLTALLAQGGKTIQVEVAEGHAGYAAGGELDLDETGEPFKVYRSGKNVRVELGKEIVLLCIDGDQYVVIDMKKKVGARWWTKSEAHPKGEDESKGMHFGKYMMDMMFPLWPDCNSFAFSGENRDRLVKSDGLDKLEVREDPLLGQVVDVGAVGQDGMTLETRRKDPNAAPNMLRWVRNEASGIRVMAYTKLFEKGEAPGSIFTVPEGVRIEDSPDSGDDHKWTVFKGFEDYIAWRNPLSSTERKPKKG